MKTAMKTAVRWFLKYRKRFAPLVLLGSVWVVGGQVFDALPRETEIRYRLGPDHRVLTEARIAYKRDRQEVKVVVFRYDDGAPSVQFHHVELTPGQYVIEADLMGPSVHRRIERQLGIPAEGQVRIDLFEAVMHAAHRRTFGNE